MKITSAEFIKSIYDLRALPNSVLSEFVFVGRSNVGKSSLVNIICNKKKLAKIGSVPGKTRQLNYFLINEKFYLVDLPGYGYAKVSKEKRDIFQAYISEYILERKNLLCLMVLIDSRLEPQKIDLEFMDWCGEKGVPFIMVFTKIDKLSKKKIADNIAHYKEEMGKHWDALPECFYTSAEKKTGRDELLNFISATNKLFK